MERPWSAKERFTASQYDETKRRVQRLQTPSATTAHRTAGRGDGKEGEGAGAGGAREDKGFLDKLQRNVSEIRNSIVRKLEAADPKLRAIIDSDIKEMQLHLDRIVLHQVSESDSHTGRAAELQRMHEDEKAALNAQHEQQLREMERQLEQVAQSAGQRVEQAEARAAALVSESAAALSRREREMDSHWNERVLSLTEQLKDDMEKTRSRMVLDMQEKHDADKRMAMRELTEALIPKIEGEITETHREEVERYQRRLDQERRRGEAKAAELQAKLSQVTEDLEHAVKAMEAMEESREEDKEARKKLGEVVTECVRLNEELCARDSAIAQLNGTVAGMEEGARAAELEVARLQLAMGDMAVTLEAQQEQASLSEESLNAEVEAQRTTINNLQQRQVRELQEIRSRVKKSMEAKDRQREELAARLEVAEGRLAETEAVLKRAQHDIETL